MWQTGGINDFNHHQSPLCPSWASCTQLWQNFLTSSLGFLNRNVDKKKWFCPAMLVWKWFGFHFYNLSDTQQCLWLIRNPVLFSIDSLKSYESESKTHFFLRKYQSFSDKVPVLLDPYACFSPSWEIPSSTSPGWQVVTPRAMPSWQRQRHQRIDPWWLYTRWGCIFSQVG